MTAEIFDIKKFAVHDGDGIRTTVFFKGCPLRCVWCHNPEGLSAAHQLALIRHKCTLCGRCADVCPQGAHQITKDTHTLDRTACTSCGRCADACPMGLNPYWLKHLCDVGDRARAHLAHAEDCIACGCCSYVCPARRRLTPALRAMKGALSDEAKRGRGAGR